MPGKREKRGREKKGQDPFVRSTLKGRPGKRARTPLRAQPPSEFERLLASLRPGKRPRGRPAETLAAAVFRKNRQNALRFLRTPYAQRVVLVPQCLRATARCQAEERGHEYVCRRCGACKIATIARRAEELGYLGVRILKGGSALPRLVAKTGLKAVLGIACGNEGLLGVLACERAGVPAFCVPLLKTGCADTDVDLEEVNRALEALLP